MEDSGRKLNALGGHGCHADGKDEVPAEQLVDAILALQHASLEDHLRITFELLDTRGDGTITRENMEEILKVRQSLPVENFRLPAALPAACVQSAEGFARHQLNQNVGAQAHGTPGPATSNISTNRTPASACCPTEKCSCNYQLPATMAHL